jgi:hypothetical protein
VNKGKKTGSAVEHESDLVTVAEKNLALYEGDSLAALTMYSLYWLQSWRLRRTIEAVAVLNWRLFPQKFAMLGYPQFPDAFRTNRSLMQGQPKYRNWLTGSASKGFSLNERGKELAHELISRFGVPATISGEKLGIIPHMVKTGSDRRARSIEPEREVARVRNTRLFEKWKTHEMADRDLIHLHALLEVFDHTPKPVRNKRMSDLERAASDIHDEEMMAFFQAVREMFGHALR